MTRFWRKIDQSNWYLDPRPDWMAADDWHGDILQDLGTTKSRLSVYEVPAEGDEKRIAFAFAATRQFLTALDYLVLEDDQFETLDIPTEQSDGLTADDYVNRLHHDITKLSAKKLGGLGISMTRSVSTDDFDRLNKYELEEGILDNIRKGNLIFDRINEKLKETLGPKL